MIRGQAPSFSGNAPSTGPLGKGKLQQETATPSLKVCFPAGNVIYSQVEALERSLVVHTAAGPGEWGKGKWKYFSMGFLDSHCDGELARIKEMVLQGMMVQSILNVIYYI